MVMDSFLKWFLDVIFEGDFDVFIIVISYIAYPIF